MTTISRMQEAERAISHIARRAQEDVAKMGAAHSLITAALIVIMRHSLLEEFSRELYSLERPIVYSPDQLEEIYGGVQPELEFA